MRKAPVALALLVALVAGCGGGGSQTPAGILADTAANLGKIKSGTLGMSLLVSPRGPSGHPFGFELHGPFSIAHSGLPVLHVSYTQIASGKRATVTVISTG